MWGRSRISCRFHVDVESGWPQSTLFRERFRASRLQGKLQKLNARGSRDGYYIFDRPKKYFLFRKLWHFKVRKYQHPWAVTSSVCIGNPIESGIRRNIPHWISYTNWSRNCPRKQTFPNFVIISFFARDEFNYSVKNKNPENQASVRLKQRICE